MQEIVFTRSAYNDYKRTVAKHPPETGGILVGSLDAPNIVSCFRFCPPDTLSNGRYNASSTVFGPHAAYINWAIDHEWGPNGLYILGFLHSHPRGCTQLSSGDMLSVKGDIPFLNAILNAPETRAAGLGQLLAPITTFAADGSDEIHGWILRRGSVDPHPARIVVQDGSDVSSAQMPSERGLSTLAHAEQRADLIDIFLRRQYQTLRRPELGFLERMMARVLYGRACLDTIKDVSDWETPS